MALTKAANHLIVVYIVCSVLYTSIYLLGFRGGSSEQDLVVRNGVASLQQRYMGNHIVNWTNSEGK